MSSTAVVCPACAYAFAFDAAAAAESLCATCPIGKGCTLACCPNCGWSTPDPARSLTGRLAGLLARSREAPVDGRTLADARPGSRVRIEGLDALPARRRDQLFAYGVAPGRLVEVLQADAVTVVRIENVELALEASLSRAIAVVPVCS